MSMSLPVPSRSVQSRVFANGLVLVAEPAPQLESAAFTLITPCGSSVDPADRLGLASLVCDMVFRGAGERDSRQLVRDLDVLGVDRSEGVSAEQTGFSGATLADNLLDALAIYADVLRRPRLPVDQLEAARQLCLQEIRGVDDDPAQKLMETLRQRTYPAPWGRASHGDEAGVAAASLDDVAGQWQTHYRPNGAILGVAGRFDWPRLEDCVDSLFGDWAPVAAAAVATADPSDAGAHTDFDSNQCHIGIAFPGVPLRDPEFLRASAAVGVLSDGSSSRLFTEVREKRGLCYSVSASLHTQVERASVFCYAGTTAERAQETLDVTHAELVRLAQGIEPAELARLKARIKSGLVMQQESTMARSNSITRDWRHLGRVRTLDEISRQVNELSVESINAYLAAHPPREFTFATLGPQPLRLPA